MCPFCGKTYKRLKSHLPHCKAAANPKPPPAQHDVPAKQTSSTNLTAASPETAPKGKKAIQTPLLTINLQRNTSKKGSAASAKQFQSSIPATSSSIPPSANNRKQKLVDQIKMGSPPSSATISLISSPPPVFTHPKNKSLRALIEAAKSKQVSEESLERGNSVSKQLLSGSASSLSDSPNTRTAAQAESHINPDKDNKPKHASTENVPKMKRAGKSLSKPKNASDSLDANINETSVESEGEMEDLSVKLLMKSRGGHQGRITLQDVKATLGRPKTTSKSSTKSIVHQTETADDLSSNRNMGTGVSEVNVPAERRIEILSSVTAKALSDQLPSSSSQHTELQSIKKHSLKSEQAFLFPLQHEASPQPKLTSPATPLLSGHLSSQASRAAPLAHTVSMSEGLKVSRHMTGLLSTSPAPTLISSPHPFLLAPPVRVEMLKADEGLTKEKLQLNVGKQNTAHGRAEGQYQTQK